jgi:predicted acyl esterase
VLLAWFDRWVMEDEGAPVPPAPTFASFEGPGPTEPDPDEGSGTGGGAGWRVLPAWDPDGRDPVTWTLGEELPVDGNVARLQQPAEPDDDGASCTFTSAPLDEASVLIGWPMLTFDATMTAPEAHFYVELVDVAADGTEQVVNDGFLKASHRRSHEAPEPVEPGRRERYTIRIRAQHHRFAIGHRVRLRLSGASSQTLEPVKEPVDVTIHLDRATLRLPGFAAADPD